MLALEIPRAKPVDEAEGKENGKVLPFYIPSLIPIVAEKRKMKRNFAVVMAG